MLTAARAVLLAVCLLVVAAPGASAAFLEQGPSLLSPNPSVPLGGTLAVSADGDTAILAGDRNRPSAFIFVRAGAVWSRQAELVPADGAGDGDHPPDVALSADGNTAVIGAVATRGGDGYPGAVYVFVRDGAAWRQQARLGPGGGCCPHLGASVAISGDGSTVAAGAPYESNSGAAYFYARTGDEWVEQGSFRLGNSYGTAGHVGEFIGGDVALSGDGSTALVASGKRPWLVTRTGGVWTAQDAAPTPSDPEHTGGSFGWAVSLSDDATTALIGGVGGPRWFTRADAAAATWTQLGAPIAAWGADPPPLGAFALSRDGQSVIAGAPGDYSAVAGTAWTFGRTADGWAPGAQLVPREAVAQFGLGVGLSGDGRTALVGGRQDRAFAFAHIPAITGIAPTAGSVVGGTKVTLSGSDFTGATGVLFGERPAASFSVTDDGHLVAVAPEATAPGPLHIAVAGPMGGSATGESDTYTYVRPAAAVRSARALLAKGRRSATVALACTVADCAGTAELVSIVRRRHGHGMQKVTTTLASGPFRLTAGARGTATLRLTEAGRKLLARAGRRRPKVTARVTVAGGRPVNRRVVLG